MQDLIIIYLIHICCCLRNLSITIWLSSFSSPSFTPLSTHSSTLRTTQKKQIRPSLVAYKH